MKNKVRYRERSEVDYELNLLMTMIFKRAFHVWERYNGAVPADALAQLDKAGDWPRGLAAATMKRLSRDHELRKRLRESLNG